MDAAEGIAQAAAAPARRLTILALGSRGDVQPFVALGLGLRRAGHAVTVAAAADYGGLVREHGLEFRALVGRIAELADPTQVGQFRAGAGNPLRAAASFLRQVDPLVDRLLRDCWEASCDADGLVASTLGAYCGAHIAERRAVPLVVAHLHPYNPVDGAPHVFFPRLPRWAPLRRAYGHLSHRLAEHAMWQLLRRPFNRPRRAVLGLAPVGPLEQWRRARAYAPPALYGYSAAVAPPPDGWAGRELVTGYWFLDRRADWRPAPELAAFLADGPPPVYVSFGSIMFGRDGERVTALVAEALARAGRRGILSCGWGDLGRGAGGPDLLTVGAVPHDWLFPQVAAVVHHGGAGVTAAALRAGAPAVVVPFLGDQHLWAARVAALGAGLSPGPGAQLSAAGLAHAIAAAAGAPAMRARAAAVGQRLREEDGVARAVALVERFTAAAPGARG